MTTIDIFAKAFGGLHIEVDIEDGDITDARFYSTGNALPAKMFTRLLDNTDDLYKIYDEAGAARY